MLLALLAVRLVDELATFLPTGAFESFRADLGLSYTQASAVLAAIAPGAIVGNVFTVLADHRSRRVISAGGAFAFAAALLGFGAAPSFALLLVAGFVIGVASTAMCDAAEIALVDLTGRDAPANISRSFLFGSVGDLAGPALLVAVAASGASWRVAFVVVGIVTLAYAAWLASLRMPPPHPRTDGSDDPGTLRAILRMPQVWYLGVLTLLLGPLDEAFLAFLLSFLQRDHGLSTAAATAVIGVAVAGNLAGFVTTSRSGYRPSAGALRSHALVMTAATATVVVVPWLAVVVLAVFVFGIALARYWIALRTRIVETVPGRVGTVSAVVSTIEFTGFVIPLGMGALADAAGVRAGVAAAAVLSAVTLLLVTFGDRARQGARPAQASSERAI